MGIEITLSDELGSRSSKNGLTYIRDGKYGDSHITIKQFAPEALTGTHKITYVVGDTTVLTASWNANEHISFTANRLYWENQSEQPRDFFSQQIVPTFNEPYRGRVEELLKDTKRDELL